MAIVVRIVSRTAETMTGGEGEEEGTGAVATAARATARRHPARSTLSVVTMTFQSRSAV